MSQTLPLNNAAALLPAHNVNPCLSTSTSTRTSSVAMPPLMTTTVPSYTSRSGSLPAGLQAARRPSALASIVLRKRNEIDIVLDDTATALTPSYSTHDEIRGNVALTFDKDTPIEEVIITFEGQACTYVEKLATTAPTTGRTTGRHTFLKLLQPVQGQQWPEDGILRAGQTYRIPFLFNVPDRLLPYVCSHKVESESIRKHHVQLPPSLGDATTSSDGQAVMDDFAPAMARISYFIRARVIQRLNARSKPVEIAEKTERVRILPQRDEEPPVEVTGAGDHCLRRVKMVRKGFLKFGKLGSLTAETSQPKSFRLPHPSKPMTEPVTTMTTIRLRFDPMTPDEQPPQLGTLVTKLRVYTFFGAAPYRILPEIHRCDNWSNLHGVYPHTIELSSRSLSSVTWTRSDDASSDGSDISRRPSALSSLSNTTSLMSSSSPLQHSSADCDSGTPFYTASILVPVSLPMPCALSSKTLKTFVPSFHCCIVSRNYTLHFSLSYSSPGSAKVSTPTISLKTPIQISQEGGAPPEGLAENDEAMVAEIERQFGLYEQRQLEGHDLDDLASPAESPVTMPEVGAPPEYNAMGGFLHRSARAGDVRVGGPRTSSLEVNTASKSMHISNIPTDLVVDMLLVETLIETLVDTSVDTLVETLVETLADTLVDTLVDGGLWMADACAKEESEGKL
ncbi:hypothetical protein DV737_g4855, partial [Chaetothyriales sp. CBS 132003]